MKMKVEAIVAEISVIDVRPGADGCRTGKGAGFLTEIEARADFGTRKKQLAVPSGSGAFLLDLHVGGDIVDTIEITEEGYRKTVGEAPRTVAQNRAYDHRYWVSVTKLAEAVSA